MIMVDPAQTNKEFYADFVPFDFVAIEDITCSKYSTFTFSIMYGALSILNFL